MTLIRQVLQHPTKKCWAYVETSDEDKNHSIVLGRKEFPTQDEAWEYSKGFEPFSYVWHDPVKTRRNNLVEEAVTLRKRLTEIEHELTKLEIDNG